MPAPNRELVEKLEKKRKNKKIAEKRLKGGIESRDDIKARVKGTPTPKPKPGSNMKSYDPMGAGLRQIKARGNDNLTHIADRAGTSVGTIMKLNSNIKNPDKISKGQSIRVPANTKGMKDGGRAGGKKTCRGGGMATKGTGYRIR